MDAIAALTGNTGPEMVSTMAQGGPTSEGGRRFVLGEESLDEAVARLMPVAA